MKTKLTPLQRAALEKWKINTAGRIFTGTTEKSITTSFQRANRMKKKNKSRALGLEKETLAICGIKAPPPD